MILLDTNIVSALMAPSPPPEVLNWLVAQQSTDLFLSTISIAEIGYGLALLPESKRRRDLQERFEKFVAQAFEQRILAFDKQAAHLYGDLMGHRKQVGRPLSSRDGQIASIARAHTQAIATRNVGDFEECGVALINPFET
jgi:predicted nucleic acid-binding protein